MTDIATIPFRIEFYGPNGFIIRTTTVHAMDHMDACDQGWANMPEGADDFQVIELEGTRE
jgi:hypothetical protein